MFLAIELKASEWMRATWLGKSDADAAKNSLLHNLFISENRKVFRSINLAKLAYGALLEAIFLFE